MISSSESGMIHNLRRGFSLIELMVAIGIIAILATIIGGALFRTGTTAREKATQATLKKIDSVLKQRATAVSRTPIAQSATASLGNITAKNILDLKNSYRQWFPQLPIDVIEADVPVGLNPTYKNLADRVRDMVRITSSTDRFGIVADNDSVAKPIYDRPAELLYAIVGKGTVIGSDEVQGVDFNASELKDVDGDGLPEIVDAWGNPIEFYRWPTRLVRPDGGISAVNPDNYLIMFMTEVPNNDELNLDVDNPLGHFLGPNFNEITFHTPGTFHPLLLLSRGPDEISGLVTADIALIDSNGNGVWDASEIDAYIDVIEDYLTNLGHLARPDPTISAGDRLNSSMNDNLTNLNIEVK